MLGLPWLEWRIHMPAALTYNLCHDKYCTVLYCTILYCAVQLFRYNWYYHTTPQTHVDNRRMYWPRGRVWGGSSSLNAMVYVRWDRLYCTVLYTVHTLYTFPGDMRRTTTGRRHGFGGVPIFSKLKS